MSDTLGTWETKWYRPNDIVMMSFTGYLSIELLNSAMDRMGELLDEAEGDLLIYIISDESKVTATDSDVHVQAILHPLYFHPRGGKLYVVGATGELYLQNEALGAMRPGAVRQFETLTEAITDIDKRRAAYFAKQQAAKDTPQTQSESNPTATPPAE